jgi:hypothetical protein
MMTKLLSLFALAVMTVLFVAKAQAAPTPNATDVKKKTTEVSFEDVLIEGKYHFADEAVTTVEGDKVVDALLNVRTDFKDRMRKSASRH